MAGLLERSIWLKWVSTSEQCKRVNVSKRSSVERGRRVDWDSRGTLRRSVKGVFEMCSLKCFRMAFSNERINVKESALAGQVYWPWWHCWTCWQQPCWHSGCLGHGRLGWVDWRCCSVIYTYDSSSLALILWYLMSVRMSLPVCLFLSLTLSLSLSLVFSRFLFL